LLRNIERAFGVKANEAEQKSIFRRTPVTCFLACVPNVSPTSWSTCKPIEDGAAEAVGYKDKEEYDKAKSLFGKQTCWYCSTYFGENGELDFSIVLEYQPWCLNLLNEMWILPNRNVASTQVIMHWLLSSLLAFQLFRWSRIRTFCPPKTCRHWAPLSCLFPSLSHCLP